jgi:hypothetical protein
MPQCPHCQTPYDAGQRYCSNCGSFLLHPEQGDTFCPQCNVRVSAKQEFCHECDAPLKGEAAAPEAAPPEAGAVAPEPPAAPEGPAAATPPATMQPWVIGLVVGAGIIILVLVILLFGWGTPPTQEPKAAAPAPSTAAPAPPAAPADFKEQLAAVLATLRGAQLNKDIVKFMSAYSLTFPELEQKRADTLKSWENFDYTNLVFTIDKVQAIDPDHVIAWVTWYIDTRNRRTQELESATQTYQVRFAKEMGQWRIRSLQEAE